MRNQHNILTAPILEQLLPLLPPPRPSTREDRVPVRQPAALRRLGVTLSRHAELRTQQRGIRAEHVVATLLVGSRHRSGADTVYFLGRRALRALPPEGRKELQDAAGTTVVLTEQGTVKTVFRNRERFGAGPGLRARSASRRARRLRRGAPRR